MSPEADALGGPSHRASPPAPHAAGAAPFRVEIVTVTGLTIAGTFPVGLVQGVAASLLQVDPALTIRSFEDRAGLRIALLRLFGEQVGDGQQVELLDDDGVSWIVPAERVLAIRVIDPERTGPPPPDEVRRIGFRQIPPHGTPPADPTAEAARRAAPTTPAVPPTAPKAPAKPERPS